MDETAASFYTRSGDKPATEPLMLERMPPGSAAPMPSRLWWMIVLRGLAALLFGLVAIFWPGISLGALVILFGAYALADGLIAMFGSSRMTAGQPQRGFMALTGIAGILIGLISIFWPEVTVVLLLYFVAAWADRKRTRLNSS